MTEVKLSASQPFLTISGQSKTANIHAGNIKVTTRITAHSIFDSYLNAKAVTKLGAYRAKVPMSRMLAVVRGRTAQPALRVWAFTLEGHDFYVLRLGDIETLIYDLSTEQWSRWNSANLPYWRVFSGITWNGAQKLAVSYGSSIIGGDDTVGLLWFLDPRQTFDDAPRSEVEVPRQKFTRTVTGQIGTRGRNAVSCYALFLNGDNYQNKDIEASLTLKISDDAGVTYRKAATLTYKPDGIYVWRSLGQIKAPGRIFQIEDDGVMTRVDDMQMNETTT